MAVNVPSLAWSMQRLFLRGGALAWATLCVVCLLCVQSVMVARTASSLAAQERGNDGLALPVQRPARELASAPALPGVADRFRITDAALARLLPNGAPPAALKFEYQSRPDAGLTRQTITYATRARWDALAPLLDTLQAVDRSVYIGRLQLRRDQPGQAELDAEIHLSTVYLDAVEARMGEGSP